MSNLQPNANATQTGATGVNGDSGAGGASGGDMLDKAVAFLERKAGHEQSGSTTEKISDGLRKGIHKITGKDIPIADKDSSQNT